MRTKPLRITLVAMLALMLATSCRQAETPPKKTLQVLMTQDWAETAPFISAVREFEDQHPDVVVKIEKYPIRLMSETVRSRVDNGRPPDVVQWHAYAAAAQGLAEPLDDLWAKYKLDADGYFPGAIADVVWGNKKYGVPLDTNALVLFYKTENLGTAQLSEPVKFETFGDLERAAQAVTLPDGSRKAFAWPNSYWSAYGWVRANGGEVVEVDAAGNPRFTLNSPAVVEALGFMGSLVKSGYAFPPAGANSNNDSLALFRAGSTAFFTSGSWDLATLDNEGSSFGVTLMPNGVNGTTQGTVMGGSSLFVPKGSENADLAFQFMTLLTSDKYALRLAKEEGRLPARSHIFEDTFFQEEKMKVFLAQLESAYPLLLDAFPDAAKAFETALNSVLIDGADAAQALGTAQEAAERSVSGAAAPS